MPSALATHPTTLPLYTDLIRILCRVAHPAHASMRNQTIRQIGVIHTAYRRSANTVPLLHLLDLLDDVIFGIPTPCPSITIVTFPAIDTASESGTLGVRSGNLPLSKPRRQLHAHQLMAPSNPDRTHNAEFSDRSHNRLDNFSLDSK
ncbi:hypothetical protein IAQ61_006301 [Plenodomus lingam]|uniref:uncharacterized protein n=1 Tax=Leptosphaeria maculans TaxID=5022 RepID=UPI0033171938|nr:hypothetical protein IAQ61_006301 [Plenodomus lingam]